MGKGIFGAVGDYIRYVRSEIPNPEKDASTEPIFTPEYDLHKTRWKAQLCEVFWGSHGCCRFIDHPGLCYCICCTCPPSTHHLPECVAYAPYYGLETRFYGEDAERRGLLLVESDGSGIEKIINNSNYGQDDQYE